MKPAHYKLAQIALEVAGHQGFALAGGYAIQAHGMGRRPSGDVDLFTDWHRRAHFPGAVTSVIAALERHGHRVVINRSGDTFARLIVSSPHEPDDEPSTLEMSADWRQHPPVVLDVGPVLHPDDAVANKMCALFGRALARDFLDVDAAITNGGYTRERLLELAENADNGFDPRMFADALGVLNQINDHAFTEYNTPPELIADMRRRFADWRRQLLSR